MIDEKEIAIISAAVAEYLGEIPEPLVSGSGIRYARSHHKLVAGKAGAGWKWSTNPIRWPYGEVFSGNPPMAGWRKAIM